MLNKLVLLGSAMLCLLGSAKIPPRTMRFPTPKARPEGYKYWEDTNP